MTALVVVLFLSIKPSPLPPTKLPNPNGFDDLVKAGRMIAGQMPDCNFDNSKCVEDWKAFLEKNKSALELARVGLSRESRVPLNLTNSAFSSSGFGYFTVLAQVFQAEGQIAEKENRLDDAITSYVDMICLSEKRRGGAVIDMLGSLAWESMGVMPLQKIAAQMTAEQSQRVVTALTEMYSNRERFDEVMTTESAYNRRPTTLREKISILPYYFSSRDVPRKLRLSMKYRRARMGLLLVDLAVRNYEAEKGGLPQTLNELVPKYLPFLPKDDFSGNDFIYRPQTNGYLLYGVGSDGKDDGGKPLVGRGIDSPGDMLNDSHY